jgi:hypothetical protein
MKWKAQKSYAAAHDYYLDIAQDITNRKKCGKINCLFASQNSPRKSSSKKIKIRRNKYEI